jgi:hypothetical protein
VIHDVPVVELTRDEILQEIDSAARDRRGMSGAELLGAFAEGRLDDPADVADILVIADLLPDDDPIRASSRAE